MRVQHGACLSSEDRCSGQGNQVLSVLIEGRWLSQNQLQCVSGRRRLQVVGITLRQVTASAEDEGALTVDLPPYDWHARHT